MVVTSGKFCPGKCVIYSLCFVKEMLSDAENQSINHPFPLTSISSSCKLKCPLIFMYLHDVKLNLSNKLFVH